MRYMAFIIYFLSLLSCGPSDNLMKICFRGEQVFYSNCESTKPLLWKKSSMPITYYVGRELDEFAESIDAGAKMWNDQTCKLLVRVDDPNEADMGIVYTGGTPGDNSVANVSHFGDGEYATNAIMRFNDTTDIHTFFHWATHEFGHILGLGHDHHSIMRPEMPEWIDNIARPLPSDGDIRLIKSLYCK